MSWLDEFVSKARAENALLRKNGAAAQADARDALLDDLLLAHQSRENETVSVEEAALLAQVNPETVRRAVRRKLVEDARPNPERGSPILIRKKDIPVLTGLRRKKMQKTCVDTRTSTSLGSATDVYDVTAHFQEILAA
ncbi:MAG TPA: hypothetical protein VF212_01125 [Longimicrobiales bacterium]